MSEQHTEACWAMPPLTRRDHAIAIAYVLLALGGPTGVWVVIIAVVKWMVG